jgi:hypothetical protein
MSTDASLFSSMIRGERDPAPSAHAGDNFDAWCAVCKQFTRWRCLWCAGQRVRFCLRCQETR